MEINGTWYARDTIKAVEKIIDIKIRWEFAVKIIIGNNITTEYMTFDNKGDAEYLRKKLIQQLQK